MIADNLSNSEKPDSSPAVPSVTYSAGISPEIIAGLHRRKRWDRAFSTCGFLLAMGALSVLAMLFGQLVYEGGGRLFRGHFVNTDGFSPKINEIAGILQHNGDDLASGWELVQRPLTIANATERLTAEELTSLIGKKVFVDGDVPSTGLSEMESNSIAASDEESPKKYSKVSLHGTLSQSNGSWIVTPSPIAILPVEGQGLDKSWVGNQVAVGFGLVKSLPLKTKSIEKLSFQNFFASKPSSKAEEAGILTALVGSVLVVIVTMCLAIPLGIAAGVWLEEYAKKNWLTALIEINIANLAGVPSIVWGLMALGIFVYFLDLGRSILTAGLTLGLLVLPIVIMATREAIRTIPSHIREASYACGATKWQTVRHHVIPYSMGGILTGTIIGLSRAIGETAPLITIGALTFVTSLPAFSWSNPFAWLNSGFTVMPIQIFGWVSRPQEDFRENAAAASIVLLALTLALNTTAIYFRNQLRKKIKW